MIDLTHGIRRHDIRAGALILARRCRTCRPACTSRSSIPTSGAERRAVALRLADGRLLVGPDNGLLSLAAAERGGGVRRGGRHRRSPFRAGAGVGDVPRPRHLRPGGGAAGRGRALADAGDAVRPAAWSALEPAAASGDRRWCSSRTCCYVDRFGNAQLDVRGAGP